MAKNKPADIAERAVEIMRDLNGKVFHRAAEIAKDSVSEESRSVDLSFSSEQPVERYYGEEILSHDPAHCRLGRLQNKAALLWNHNPDDQRGVIESATMEAGKGRATVRFSRSAKGDELFRDVQDGIVSLVSVGYRIHKVEIEKRKDGDIVRVIDWEPLEISLVSIPADDSVGVGRSVETKQATENNHERTQMPENNQEQQTPKIDVVNERRSAAADARKLEARRVSDILAIADQSPVDITAEAREYLADPEKSVADFQKFAFGRLCESNAQREASTQVGMSDKDIGEYNLARALQCLIARKPVEGLEKEASDAMAKIVGRGAEGFYIPQDFILRGLYGKRDQLAGTSSTGGNLVQTNLLAGNFIELLRNRTVCKRLGATVISGLTGNVSIPRQLTASTAAARAESGSATESSVTFEQVNGNPHSVAAYTEYSKRLLTQASLAINPFLVDDMSRQIAIKQDLNCLEGTGSGNSPLGIVNTTGINTVTFGAAATFGKMVDMESAVETDNALLGTLAYCTTPAAKGKLKQKVLDSGSGRFVWTSMAGDPNQDGEVNGYRAAATKQISSDKAIFGNWADLVIMEWAGLDVTIDPTTKAEQSLVRVIITQDQDCIVRHPVSFCVSTDSAAQ